MRRLSKRCRRFFCAGGFLYMVTKFVSFYHAESSFASLSYHFSAELARGIGKFLQKKGGAARLPCGKEDSVQAIGREHPRDALQEARNAAAESLGKLLLRGHELPARGGKCRKKKPRRQRFAARHALRIYCFCRSSMMERMSSSVSASMRASSPAGVVPARALRRRAVRAESRRIRKATNTTSSAAASGIHGRNKLRFHSFCQIRNGTAARTGSTKPSSPLVRKANPVPTPASARYPACFQRDFSVQAK